MHGMVSSDEGFTWFDAVLEERCDVALPFEDGALSPGLFDLSPGVCPTGVTLTSCRGTVSSEALGTFGDLTEDFGCGMSALAAKVDISDWRAEATLPGSISTGRVPLVGEALDALISDLLADSTTPLCARGSLPGWARCDFRRFLDIVSG